MTPFQAKRRAARAWACVQDKPIRRHYQHQWLRAVNLLGDKYLLAIPVEKKQ
jgi:hypothetical protein